MLGPVLPDPLDLVRLCEPRILARHAMSQHLRLDLILAPALRHSEDVDAVITADYGEQGRRGRDVDHGTEGRRPREVTEESISCLAIDYADAVWRNLGQPR